MGVDKQGYPLGQWFEIYRNNEYLGKVMRTWVDCVSIDSEGNFRVSNSVGQAKYRLIHKRRRPKMRILK